MNREWRIVLRFLIEAMVLLVLFAIYAGVIDKYAKSEQAYYGPDVISIDKVQPRDVLGTMYVPISYRHRYHAKLLKDCTICHHHFDLHFNDKIVAPEKCEICHESPDYAPQSQSLPCDICHDPGSRPGGSILELDDGTSVTLIGLEEAYHGQCITCHRATKGPFECDDCHAKRK